MSLQLSETLKAHMVKSKENGMKLGLGDHPEYVFTNRLGGFVDVNNWRRRVFVKALEKAKLRQIRIHDLGHTYATLSISKGDNIADVSNQLGHYSEMFTMKIYYHWMPGKKKAEVTSWTTRSLKIKMRHTMRSGKPFRTKKIYTHLHPIRTLPRKLINKGLAMLANPLI